MGESIGTLIKELGPGGLAGLIGGGLKGIGGVIKAATAKDPNEPQVVPMTEGQTGVANQLASSFGLSGGGQPLQGQPGLGNNLMGRVAAAQQRMQGLQAPNTNRFGLGKG